MKSIDLKCLMGISLAGLLSACGGGDDSGTSGSGNVTSQSIEISVAGIKGPLAFADINIYTYDASFPDYYDPSAPVASAMSDQFAQIKNMTIKGNISPPYILTIGGANAIDLNTGKPPVISTLVAVISDRRLGNKEPVYATPLTTLAYRMAHHASNPGDAGNFVATMESAAQSIAVKFAISPDTAIDIFESPVVIDKNTDTLAEQQEAVHHRAALEAFAAKVFVNSQNQANVSTDDTIEYLGRDLQSDGKIDNMDNGILIGGIDPNIMKQDPMIQVIPDTSSQVKDIVTVMESERILMGTDKETDFQTENIVLPETEDSGSEPSNPDTGETPSPDPEPAPAPAPEDPVVTFPLDLTGSTPEELSVTLSVSKPGGVDTAVITLSAFDADQSNEGELIINGNPPVRLFGASGTGANNSTTADVSVTSPASYWSNGDNMLTFRHTSSAGFVINSASVAFTSPPPAPLPAPSASLSTNSINFGSINVGSVSSTSKLIVTNSGDATLLLSGISISQNFNKSDDCSSGIAAGSSCTISMRFVPTAAGTVNGTLTFNTNDANSSYSVSLSGTGKDGSSQTVTPDVDPFAPEIKYYNDFNDDVPHVYTGQDLLDKWNGAASSNINSGRVEVVGDPDAERGNVLRILYEGGKILRGAQWRTPVGPHEELYFSYDIMFDDTFEFVKGGKIPGMMGGPEIYTGGKIPDGTDGWTGRMMWRAEGAMVNYMYFVDMPSTIGKDFDWDDGAGGQAHFNRGQWHTVEMRYKMNTVGKSNGVLQAWLDGELVLDRTLRYRTSDSVKVDEILFSTFYGGNDMDFAPVNDHFIYYDNFVVSTKPISH